MEGGSKVDDTYDVVIVGGGMAGLRIATELLRRGEQTVALYEKYGGVGGRCWTYKGKVDGTPIQWEGGAGRISSKHRRVLELIQRYRLRLIPIGSGLKYKESSTAPFEPNLFEPAIPALLDPLAGLPKEDLGRATIRQLLGRVNGAGLAEDYLERFPYRSEVETMRADLALQSFREEMRSHEGYSICREGLSSLARAMRKDIERRGGAIRTGHQLVGFKGVGTAKANPLYEVEFAAGAEGGAKEKVTVLARRLILAIPSAALEEVEGLPAPLAGWRGLRRLKMTPLLRFYGAFPLESNGKPWWDAEDAGGSTRVVTPDPVRYFIPGGTFGGKVATCHMSYTDSRDAEPWLKMLEEHGEKAAGEEMLGGLRRLLKPNAPPPLFVKAHAWKEGVTSWLPGPYDAAEYSREALHPCPEDLPRVHLCGESYSLRQGWIEGALEHADALLGLLRPKSS
jgi:monoamine oxidase